MSLRTKNAIRRTTEDKVIDSITLVFVTFILLVTVYPFYYVIIMSFNDGLDALQGGIYLWPRKFTTANYVQFLSDPKWVSAIGVTVAKTVVGTTLTLGFTCLVAYGMSTEGLKFKKGYYLILLFCMYFSGGLIPYYLVLRSYGLLNKFAVYVIPTMFSTYYCILAISFFREIPMELKESARLDGAGELTIFVRIIIPLSKACHLCLPQFHSGTPGRIFFAPANKAHPGISDAGCHCKKSCGHYLPPGHDAGSPAQHGDWYIRSDGCHDYRCAAHHVRVSLPAKVLCKRHHVRCSQRMTQKPLGTSPKR